MSRIRIVPTLLCLLIGQMISSPARADDFVLPDSMQGVAVRKLSLQEALHIAIENNLGIQLQAQDLIVSEANIEESEAAFEPTLEGRVSYRDSISPPQSSLEGMSGDVFTSVSQAWSVSLAKRIQWGTRFSLDAASNRLRSSAGSAVAPLNYGANVGLSITQPLWRGFSLDKDVPRQGILRATFADQATRAAYRLQMHQEVRRTEEAYWNLVEAMQSFDVQRSSLTLAQEQFALTERQIAAGILAPADSIGSESAVAQRELALLSSETRMEQTMDILRQTLNLPLKGWQAVLVPSDMPKLEERQLSEEDAMALALTLRDEMTQLEIDAKLAELNQRLADNEGKPAVDLGLNYGLVGQGDEYRDSLNQVGGLGARDWSVSVNFRWEPLGGAAKARSTRARANAQSTALRREQFVLAMRTEIRSALRALESAKRGVAASERFLSLAERSLEAEQRRFLSGKSRNFEVSQREDALAQARTEALRAVIDFERASSALDLATGQLLQRKKIELEVAP